MNERIVEFEKIPIYFIKEVVPPSYILSSEIKSIIKNKKIVCFAKTARIFSINLRTQIAALESCDDDSILVFEARECKAPAWGEMLSLLALNQGVKGTILDGIVEDKEEILNMNYPVYAREIRPKPSHQELFEFEGMEKMGKSEMDCSIVCGDVKINLGDLIIIEDDSIIAIPKNEIEKTLEKVKKLIAKSEELVMEEVVSEELDEIDINILEMLEENSRRTYEEIGEKLGISKGTVFLRINKMKEKKIIKKFTIDVDFEKINRKLLSFMSIATVEGKTFSVSEKIKEILDIMEIHILSDNITIFVKVRTKDIESLASIFRKISLIEGVIRIKESIPLRTMKERFL